MINLIDITDNDVRNKIIFYLDKVEPNSELWRILKSTLELSKHYSFSNTRTYPRPDHPVEWKRKPIIYMLVAILISLRTTLENEQKAVFNLITKFPDSTSLYKATAQEIEDCIRPAGMANKKSLTIRKALDYVLNNFNGDIETLSKLELEEARNAILKIPGVGPKSADCLLSIGLGKPSIAVDVNVFRSTSWIFDLPWSENPNYNDNNQIKVVKDLLDNLIPKDVFLTQIIHTLFLLHGKNIGNKHPQGKPCILNEFCLTCKKNMLQYRELALFSGYEL